MVFSPLYFRHTSPMSWLTSRYGKSSGHTYVGRSRNSVNKSQPLHFVLDCFLIMYLLPLELKCLYLLISGNRTYIGAECFHNQSLQYSVELRKERTRFPSRSCHIPQHNYHPPSMQLLPHQVWKTQFRTHFGGNDGLLFQNTLPLKMAKKDNMKNCPICLED